MLWKRSAADWLETAPPPSRTVHAPYQNGRMNCRSKACPRRGHHGGRQKRDFHEAMEVPFFLILSLQLLPQKDQRIAMGLSRCTLVVTVAMRAVEAMLGLRIHDDFHVVVVVETLGDFLHRFQG